MASISNSPLFWQAGAISETIARFRGKPGDVRFNARLNSLGCYDDEFFVAKQQDVAVALLADSFGWGVVPLAYNFATVAERQLTEQIGEQVEGRVAIHDFGI